MRSRQHIEKLSIAFEHLKADAVRRAYQGVQNENVSGNFIYRSRNSHMCFDVEELEDCSWLSNVVRAKDCHFGDYFLDSELCFETLSTPGCYDVAFCEYVWNSNLCRYSSYCFYCENIFGCVGIHRKKNCILNREYSAEDYQRLCAKIDQDLINSQQSGSFFPATLSPFAYNETAANDEFPPSREEAATLGFRWKDEQFDSEGVEREIDAGELPDSIEDVSDDIVRWAVRCGKSGRLFRVQKQELKFYSFMNLSLPRIHPDVRHGERMKLRGSRQCHEIDCGSCGKKALSNVVQDGETPVFCESCYANLVQ